MSRGARGLSSSFISCRKRAAKGIRSHDYRSRTEMVEAETSIRLLKMVLADGSSASTSFEEEMVLVVVGDTSPDVSNSFSSLSLEWSQLENRIHLALPNLATFWACQPRDVKRKF